MKKIICFILALVTVLTLSACGGTETPATEPLTEGGITGRVETGEATQGQPGTEEAQTEPFVEEDPVFYQPTEKTPTDPDSYDFSKNSGQ